jgi:hypothetical protein
MAGVGAPKKVSVGAMAAGIGGLVLILSLFLPWYGSGGFDANGWESAKIVDIILLFIAAAAIAFAVLELTGSRVSLPFGLPRTLQVLGIIATTITMFALLEGESQAFGIFLAVLASIAILVGGWFAERRPAQTVTLGGGAPAGGGYGPPPVGPGAGAAAQPPAQQPAYSPPPAAPPPAQAAPPPPPGGTPDWYPDPRGEKRLRYFDGNQWTDHVAD